MANTDQSGPDVTRGPKDPPSLGVADHSKKSKFSGHVIRVPYLCPDIIAQVRGGKDVMTLRSVIDAVANAPLSLRRPNLYLNLSSCTLCIHDLSSTLELVRAAKLPTGADGKPAGGVFVDLGGEHGFGGEVNLDPDVWPSSSFDPLTELLQDNNVRYVIAIGLGSRLLEHLCTIDASFPENSPFKKLVFVRPSWVNHGYWLKQLPTERREDLRLISLIIATNDAFVIDAPPFPCSSVNY